MRPVVDVFRSLFGLDESHPEEEDTRTRSCNSNMIRVLDALWLRNNRIPVGDERLWHAATKNVDWTTALQEDTRTQQSTELAFDLLDAWHLVDTNPYGVPAALAVSTPFGGDTNAEYVRIDLSTWIQSSSNTDGGSQTFGRTYGFYARRAPPLELVELQISLIPVAFPKFYECHQALSLSIPGALDTRNGKWEYSLSVGFALLAAGVEPTSIDEHLFFGRDGWRRYYAPLKGRIRRTGDEETASVADRFW